MGIKPIFDREKSIECILFLADSEPNTYELLKLLYFAEKIHLERFGRLITGDTYVAMKSGPVPSSCYDMIKYTRGYPGLLINGSEEGFHMDHYLVIPDRKYNRDYLSDSEVECLTEAIERFSVLSPSQKKILSHDGAYEATFDENFQNRPIPLEEIAKILPGSKELLEHLGY